MLMFWSATNAKFWIATNLLCCPLQNALLGYEKLVKAKTQVVAGTMYYLTVEVKDGEVKKLYEAKVWEKPWENFKELQEFKPVEEGASA